ncbi:MAG TPA: enoyl-CoA hydratase/isomerase family protein [Spirochaetota bacterium]|nr:enoyl-CoA hydratase/isomerase family protein [Spirochaetota bacterium]HOR93662.1 enoyl-CoA hydratase/isomerase family protein [Spirochaetota bacterium]HPK45583.1 enoyl-CoA hydratase/isomerase family protein [Spirochaetota bacterium]HQG41439.1 enoyl-CoA hydratase/isomerase family protein [Spirochaetota bacterium]HQI38208.1 enoyl-CoA hydratase/isomerase family protein [Spirochaetota bacterium]
MGIVEWKKDENIAIITMNTVENRHNVMFAQAMLQALDEAEADREINGIVLTSSDAKNFSLGVDIEWLMPRMAEKDFKAIKDFMYGMNNVFKRLLLTPMPVIAAINGHAFGNGAILSCACDFRFMRSDRGFFCFPEVDLGIPFLPGMIAFVKKALPYYKFNEMKLTGRRVPAPELAEHHIIEKACANVDELMNESIAFAKSFKKKRGIFGEHKKRLHKHIIEVIDKEDPEFIESLFLFIQD